MSVFFNRKTCFFSLAIIAFIGLQSQIALAGDFGFLGRITPHISLNKNEPSQELLSLSSGKRHLEGDYASPVLESMRVNPEDIFSLGLGAHFKISEWLDIGAACSLPLPEEEAIGTEDMSVEAMLTMQF